MSKDIKKNLILAIVIIFIIILLTSYLYHLGKEFYKFTYTQKYKVLLRDIFITLLLTIILLIVYTIRVKNNLLHYKTILPLILIFIVLEICIYILYKQSLNLRMIKNVKLVDQLAVKPIKGGNSIIYVFDDNNIRYEVKINKSWFSDYFLIDESSDNIENILLHNLVSSDLTHSKIYDLKVYGYNFNNRHRFPIIYYYKIINE
jgi:hypothetical protein